MRARPTTRQLATIVGACLAVAVAAVPALGQETRPSSSIAPGVAASDEPSAKPPKSPKPAKGDREPGTPVTIRGSVRAITAADGTTTYTMTVAGERLVLSAGPGWYWGTTHPLAAVVGRTVTITGEREGASLRVAVETIDARRIREAGKPPWAGGWKVVGEKHPGWTVEKAARWAEKIARWALRRADGHPGLGRTGAPGQAKDRPAPSGG